MPCEPISDVAEWTGRLQDSELRACMRKLMDIIHLEIPLELIDFALELIRLTEALILERTIRISFLLEQDACINVVMDQLGAALSPEVNKLKNIMNERKAALDAERAALALSVGPQGLPAQVVMLTRIKDEMVCQKANATFFTGIIDGIAP